MEPADREEMVAEEALNANVKCREIEKDDDNEELCDCLELTISSRPSGPSMRTRNNTASMSMLMELYRTKLCFFGATGHSNRMAKKDMTQHACERHNSQRFGRWALFSSSCRSASFSRHVSSAKSDIGPSTARVVGLLLLQIPKPGRFHSLCFAFRKNKQRQDLICSGCQETIQK
jgi:hypothetical protein